MTDMLCLSTSKPLQPKNTMNNGDKKKRVGKKETGDEISR